NTSSLTIMALPINQKEENTHTHSSSTNLYRKRNR
ncbi:MAG: hypothetical protein ACI90V_010396, partial [Bacillariaceae sp.]